MTQPTQPLPNFGPQVQPPHEPQRIAVDVRPRNKPLGDQVVSGIVMAGLLILIFVVWARACSAH